MKKILSILTVLVVGFFVLSGVGVAVITPGATLSFQKQLADDGSSFVKQISKNSRQQIPDNKHSFIMSSGQESELQNERLDSLLSLYGIRTEDTIGEFEQVLYNLVSKRKWRNPRLVTKLMNDIDKLSEILEQIGVTDPMTIAEALPIIKNNKERLQEEGINLLCSIDMHAYDGGTFPLVRFYKAIFGRWTMGPIWTEDYATIKGIIGLQQCDYHNCKNDTEGSFIGLIGNDPPVIGYAFELTCQPAWVRGFVLFSKSDVPFVESNGGFEQTQCPCNQ
jgi:hypothetical protein